MNGATLALKTAAAAGVEICFANPGTTEMEFVSALDETTEIRSVLCLFEGVVTGAADGYGRIAEKPALTLMHLGPGFANGIANLHNARRANSPIVNLIGDHASWHLEADAPLTSDIDSLAAPVSAFLHRVESANTIGPAMAKAIAAANGSPQKIATLILPQEAAWETTNSEEPSPVPIAEAPDTATSIEDAARRLHDHKEGMGLLIGGTLSAASLHAAASIAEKTGCRIWMETFPSRVAQGRGLPAFEAIPYFPEQATEALSGISTMVTAGASAPVAFFGYPGGQSYLLPETCEVLSACGTARNPEIGLQELARALKAPAKTPARIEPMTAVPDGPIDAVSLGAVIASQQPENAILVNEAATSGMGLAIHARQAPQHDMIHLTGGAIGQGLPSAVGAALAAPERPVLAIQADGSGMYTLQSLWTMARENLNVTVILCANRAYRILQFELARSGNQTPGPAAQGLMDLSRPDLDWVMLAKGMGVPAATARTTGELSQLLRERYQEQSDGPFLIEALIA